jgi:hypothetical protein
MLDRRRGVASAETEVVLVATQFLGGVTALVGWYKE